MEKEMNITHQTQSGRQASQITMQCIFNNTDELGNHKKFTYRGDITRRRYAQNNLIFATELEAITHKLKEVSIYSMQIIIYNNTLPPGEQIIFKKVNQNIIINHLSKTLQQL